MRIPDDILSLLSKYLEVIEKSVQNYKLTSNPKALDDAIEAWERVLDLSDIFQAYQSVLSAGRNDTGILYLERYKTRGRISDLNRALELWEQNVAFTPEGYPDYAKYLNNIGTALGIRFEHLGHIDDLYEAIKVCKQAVAATPKEHSDLAMHLSNLGNGLKNRFKHIGGLNDLEEAIKAYNQAVAATPKEHPNLAGYLNNLGSALGDRYECIGRLDDLEESIKVCRQAVAATPEADPNLALHLTNLGNGFFRRFERIDRLDDLEEAIKIYRRAVAVTYREHPYLAGYLSNLGMGLTRRFERTACLDDLEESINVCRQAVAMTPKEHLDLAMRLNNLGIGLTKRFEHTGSLDDMEESIKVYKQAVAATPKGHPGLAGYLSNLGNALGNRYERIGRLDDLEESINICKQAVEATAKTQPALARHLNNLGNMIMNKFKYTGRSEDLEDAIQSYRRACDHGLLIAPKETVRAGRNWQRWAFQRGSWGEVVDAYSLIERGMEQWLSFQFSRIDKSFSLENVQGLAAQVSYAHLQLGRVDEAVRSLEKGRTHLLREAMERQRRDLYRLEELGFTDLYKRFIQASGRYDALLAQAQSKICPADWVEQVEGALMEMKSASESIREYAGAKNPEYRFFLKSLPLEEIQEQAHGAPLVYLAATSSDGMAIIVNSARLKVIELPELSSTVLRNILQGLDDEPQSRGYLGAYMEWRNNYNNQKAIDAWSRTLEECTCWLWDAIMGKVLANLEAEAIREAVLIPTGLLGLLPLHAACTKDQSCPTGRRYALDNLTFTYAPSAQALYYARQCASRPADTLLAVENPDGTLHFAEPEVKSILSHFPGKYNHLLRDKARKEMVIQAIGSSHVLHFSTHGLAGWQDAESSYLKLADGDLILPELFELHLDQARLAILSACETGVPGTRLLDEVISLPCALMQAGVPGVIGSLWSVDDMSTAMLMARFYDLWRDDGLSPPEALRQAQIWLRDSTVEELKCKFKSFMEIHGFRMSAEAAKSFYEKIGWEDSEARPFGHPFYWGAFGYTGL